MSESEGSARREKVLGELIRAQREAARLSLRDLAALTNVSNPYLSQIERGLHEPSVRVLRSIADALGMSAETLLTSAGLIDDDGARPPGSTVEAAIDADERLTPEQRASLVSVYRSYLAANGAEGGTGGAGRSAAGAPAPANRRGRRPAGAD